MQQAATEKPRRSERRRTGTGIGVDASGGPVIDPTLNVLALVQAANDRQDDLRAAQDKYMESEIRHLALVDALLAAHSKELREKESERLDSIRQVDVQARDTAADRAADAIQALAATTATNAENLRTALANTAATIAKQTADTAAATAKQMSDQFSAMTERIAALEKSSYEGVGKQRIADPQMQEMVAELKSLRESRSQVAGKGEGINAAWIILLGAVSLVSALAAAGSFIYSATRTTTLAAPQPIIVQVPTNPPPTTVTTTSPSK